MENNTQNTDLSRNDGNTMLAEAICIKPILFSTDMVRAIEKGVKNQTRRILKYSKEIANPKIGFTAFCDSGEFAVRGVHKNGQYGESFFKLPFKKGDILWVRETFSENGYQVIYRSNVCSKWDLPDNCKWKPSLFMPKKYCRFFLEVTNVRIERLQEITEDDAINEGIERVSIAPFVHRFTNYLHKNKFAGPKESFKTLWMKINGIESWEVNPYVFVCDFKVVERPNGFS